MTEGPTRPQRRLKLFIVTVKGFEGRVYVVADNCEEAYLRVRHDFDSRQYGQPTDRVLHTVELVAETGENNETGTRLYVGPDPYNTLSKNPYE